MAINRKKQRALAGVFRGCLSICTGVLKHTVTSTLTPNTLFLIARGSRWYTPDLRFRRDAAALRFPSVSLFVGTRWYCCSRRRLLPVACQAGAPWGLQTATTGHRDPDCRECGSCSAVSRLYVPSTHATIYQLMWPGHIHQWTRTSTETAGCTGSTDITLCTSASGHVSTKPAIF